MTFLQKTFVDEIAIEDLSNRIGQDKLEDLSNIAELAYNFTKQHNITLDSLSGFFPILNGTRALSFIKELLRLCKNSNNKQFLDVVDSIWDIYSPK